MKVIVFGGNGFVGQWLIRRLKEEGRAVLSCDLPDSSALRDVAYQKIDIRELAQIEKAPIEPDDVVVNLVANQYHGKVPRRNRKEWFLETNTTGAEHILRVAAEKGCSRFVQFTTDMTYGKPQYLPIDTNHPQNPFGPYGQSKKAVEDICRQYRAKGMNITIFRPRMINGPGRLGILKKLFWLIRHNLPVPTVGSGRNCYKMVSVFDCVSAIILAIEKGCPNREYNLGSEDAPSTRELLQNLIRSVDSRSVVIPTPGKLVKGCLEIMGAMGLEIMYKEQYMIADEDYILDISNTKDDLGWEPKYSDADMIVQAYREWSKSKER